MLKVLGVAAPHYICKPNAAISTSLNSHDPFSLFNAFRVSAQQAQSDDEFWSQSNWSTQLGRDSSIFMMQYFHNEKLDFIQRLCDLRPNLLLIGTMSIGFAGAIEIAKIAKSMFGEDIFVVLGGKHVNETFFQKNGAIRQLSISPLKLMSSQVIPKVFDIIVSGDGEEIIWQIGRAVGYALSKGLQLRSAYQFQGLGEARGKWIAGWLDESDSVHTLKSRQLPLDNDSLPSTIRLFKSSSNFDVFDADITMHTMSYLSPGCIYNCHYCSEGCKINGGARQRETAPRRLHRNLMDVESVGRAKYNSRRISAFVEDSILLGGCNDLLIKFADLLSEHPINVVWGCQFTIDKLLDDDTQHVVCRLSTLGLKYIFVGLETGDESIAISLSKSKPNSSLSWMERNENVIKFLRGLGISYGVSLLFGLGETHASRMNLMATIGTWKSKYSLPNVISMNLAVQHPLQKYDLYDYVNWGTPANSDYLSIFTTIFGEASEKYPLPNVGLPSIQDLEELHDSYVSLSRPLQYKM